MPLSPQLPGRLQTLLRLKQEREDLAKLKDSDPLKTLDPDEASRRRLQEMKEAAAKKLSAAGGAAAASAQGKSKVVLPDDDDDDSAAAAKASGRVRGWNASSGDVHLYRSPVHTSAHSYLPMQSLIMNVPPPLPGTSAAFRAAGGSGRGSGAHRDRCASLGCYRQVWMCIRVLQP